MKKSIYILLLAVALVGVQACASKSEKDEAAKAAELAAIKAPGDETTTAPSREERRLAAEKKRVILAEKRKLAWEENLKTAVTYKDQDGVLVYNKAEQDPSFNGGDRALSQYFRDNIQFPEDAKEEGLDGTVYVDFVVSANGRVRQVQAVTIAGETVDQRFVDEALRVVKAMPNWVPGRQHGKAVAVNFSVPVTFEIAG